MLHQLYNCFAPLKTPLRPSRLRRGQKPPYWRIGWQCITLLSTVVACGFELSPSTSSYLSTASLAGSIIFFLRQKLIDGEWLSMTGEMTGKLVLVNGCLRVAPSTESDSYLVVWGPDYSLSVKNETIQIHNGAGQVAVRVGEDVYMGGGRAPSLNFPSVDRGLEKNSPRNARVPTFIAGDVIRDPRGF